MKFVITGGAGSGKSTVVNHLRSVLGQDATFRDVDEIVRNIHRSPERYFSGDKLAEWLTLVNVPNLREQVFANPSLRLALESLSTPIVKDEIAKPYDTAHLVLEFPLLFEKGSFTEIISYDVLVVIFCRAAVRRQRCAKRGWSDKTIDNVFASQVSDANRIDMAMELSTRMKVITIDSHSSIESVIDATNEIVQVARPA